MSNRHAKEDWSELEKLLQRPWPYNSELLGGNEDAQAGRFQEALETYDRLLELDSDNILVHILKGKAYRWLQRIEEATASYLQALALVERVLSNDPDNVSAYLYKGDILFSIDCDEAGLKDCDELALQAYEQAIRLDPTNLDAYLNKGWLLSANGRFREAMQAYDQALLLDPTNPDIYAYKGEVYWETGRFEKALQAHEQSIALNPAEPTYYADKATVLTQLGRMEEAKQADAQYRSLMEHLGRVEIEYPVEGFLTPKQREAFEQELRETWLRQQKKKESH